MLPETPTQLLTVPKDFVSPLESSVYEELQDHLTKDQIARMDKNPAAILDFLQKFCPAHLPVKKRDQQYAELVTRFSQERPTMILDFAAEEDYGYSLIYLANEFAKIKSDVRIYVVYDITMVNRDQFDVINKLILLAGIPQIVVPFTLNTSDALLLELSKKIRFEWVILNHESEQKDLQIVKMFESLSTIQPRVSLMRINDFSGETDLQQYLLSSPMIKQLYSAKLRNSKYSGRWNLLYDEVSCKNCKNTIYKCTDFLD